jgi:hypothetical protein
MRLTVALVLAALVGCERTHPAFEVRGLGLKTSSTEYGETFTYDGTVVQTAPQRDANDYYVLLQVVRLSGGKPSDWPKDTVHYSAIVLRGAGDIAFSGGYRPKSTAVTRSTPDDQWTPAKITARVVGYTPIVRTP